MILGHFLGRHVVLLCVISGINIGGQAAKSDAIKQAKAENGIVRVIEGEVGDDGKRAIGYVIEKNKGLHSQNSLEHFD
jgi:hypothetical protein